MPKNNIVDSCGWVAVHTKEKGFNKFEEILQRPDKLIIPVITILEVRNVITKLVNEQLANYVISKMKLGEIIDINELLAIEASKSAEKYNLAAADSLIFATAQKVDAVIWTLDAHFEGLPNVNYLGKKHSSRKQKGLHKFQRKKGKKRKK